MIRETEVKDQNPGLNLEEDLGMDTAERMTDSRGWSIRAAQADTLMKKETEEETKKTETEKGTERTEEDTTGFQLLALT